jgi:arylsulfatase A-like enzyme
MRFGRKATGILLLVAVALTVVLVLGRRSPPAPRGVLLITVDTLRPDHLGCYGYPRATSPAIDALAAGGVTYTAALAPRGQTWPTLASILTGLYPVTHGVRKNGQMPDPSLETLPEILGRRGFTCAAFLANSGQARWAGFAPYVDMRDQDARLSSQARGWLRAVAGKRFFLWIHYFSPHRPYQPPPPFDTRFDRDYVGVIDGSIEQMERITAKRIDLPERDLAHMLALYDGEILYMDRLVGGLLAAVRELGLDESVLVVLTADHGEDLYERNYYFSHSASVYDSSLRIPLIFRWSGRLAPGSERPGIVEATDIAPTILELVGCPLPPTIAGVSLTGQLLGEEPAASDRCAFGELEDRVVTLRDRDHRYVYNPTDFDFPVGGDKWPEAVYPLEARELYLLGVDPQERHNVAAELPAVADELERRVRDWQAEHLWEEASRRHARRAIPEELRRSLEALGYVQ